MSEIVNLTSPTSQDVSELKEIFFESSTKKDFKDGAEKEAFFEKYLGIYLKRFPEHVWVAREGRILGYMIASPVTKDSALYAIQPHLQVFESYYQDYPAHLHVNFHPDARGKGFGGKLFSELEKQLQRLNINGIHIMTGPDSRNKSFYQRLGFDFEIILEFKGSSILMMGKRL
jgi:GNAT superfamily N-acetyltransferase